MTSYTTAAQAACEQIQIQYEVVPVDGKLHPVAVIGKGPHNKSGRIKLFTDNKGGVVMNNVDGTTLTFWFDDTPTKLTEADRAERSERLATEKLEREATHRKCREESKATWEKALKEIPSDNAYFAAKGITSPDGIRYLPDKDLITVPISSIDGVIHGLQFISPDGSKRFKTGTSKKGHYFKIGTTKDNTVILSEGLATGANIHEATGHCVVVCFDAGNLQPVAQVLRNKFPSLNIIIAADNDIDTAGNPGRSKATAAALSVNARLAIATFTPEQIESFRTANDSKAPTDFNDLARLADSRAVKDCFVAAKFVEPKPTKVPVDDESQHVEEPNTQPTRPLFISGSSFFEDDVKPEYLIKPLVETNCDWMLVGPSGEGKTFVILDAAIAIVVGGKTFGGYQCKQGAALYLAGEGHGGIKRRVRAIAKSRGLSPCDLKQFYISTSTIGFDRNGLAEAISAARAIEAKHGVTIRLIIVDTLHRHMIGEENSAKDTGDYIRSVQKLRESFPGATTCTVHHVGHGKNTADRGRGSSAVPAAMDVNLLCNKGLLTFKKLKDGIIPEPLEFKLMPVEIGVDDDGEPITSCVVEYGDRAQKHRVPSLTGQEKIVVRLLDDIDGKSQLIGDLRKRFYDYRRNIDPEVKINTLKNAYLKAVESLSVKQVIYQNENLVSLATTEPSCVILSSLLS